MDKYELYKYESEDKNNRRIWRVYYGIDTGLKNPNQKFKYGAHTLDGSEGILLTQVGTNLEGTPTALFKRKSPLKIKLTMKEFNSLSDITTIPSSIISSAPTENFKTALMLNQIKFKEQQFSRDIFANAVSKYYADKSAASSSVAVPSSVSSAGIVITPPVVATGVSDGDDDDSDDGETFY